MKSSEEYSDEHIFGAKNQDNATAKNFPLNRKKILVEDFSGEKCSDKECSNE
jgi:hypothetical protein